MNDLVFLKNEAVMTDSLKVAEMFEKRHDRVLRSIETLLGGLPKNGETKKMFVKSWYIEKQNGQRYPKYLMDRDGFSLLVMGFTGKKALEWKLKYIQAFNKMEAVIREKQSSSWLEARQQGRLTRRAETDMIQQLVEYAKEQGSQHSDMLYMVYTRLSNKLAGVTNRQTATTMQLINLTVLENAAMHEIRNGILAEKHYKQIYRDCKIRLEAISGLAYIGQGSDVNAEG